MTTVAIAGGLGDLGRTLVDSILQTNPQHRVIILTRKVLIHELMPRRSCASWLIMILRSTGIQS